MPWDDDLTGVAREIAESDAACLRVVAGPGTGKTFSMMRRVARLLADEVPPSRILVCTFTRTAANDLRSELARLGVPGCDAVRAGTLHSYCFGVLAREEVFWATGRVPRPLLLFEEEFMVRDLYRVLGKGIRECRRTLKAFDAAWARLQTDEPGWCQDPDDQAFREALVGWLRFHRAILIGELVPETLAYLRLNPLSDELTAYDHVVVDEYQDLNRADQELLNLLAARGCLAVVGDEDQSIYSFRHAHPGGIRSFHQSHVGTEDKTLDECRRCPQLLVTLANRLIARNPDRTPRQLRVRPDNPQGEVYIVQWSDMDQEAAGIAKFVHKRVSSGAVSAGNVLVLAPRREFGYAVRDRLNELGTPAHSFYHEQTLDAAEAREALTLLTLLADPDDRVALRCWCGFGSDQLRSGEWLRLRSHCGETLESPRQALGRLAAGEIAIPHTSGIVARFQALQARLAQLEGAEGQALIDLLLPADAEWASPMREMASSAEGEDGTEAEADGLTPARLRERLRVRITQPELPTDVDYVRVMSLQKSKGLTADLVVMQGTIQGLTPYLPLDTSADERPARIEEGRRLFYVALTRATSTLVISFPMYIPATLAHRLSVPSQPAGPNNRRATRSQYIDELQGPGFPGRMTGPQFLQQTGSL